jgi:hypothetical protein
MDSTKCTCNNCSGHIGFEPSQAGTTVTCPHCQMETKLYIPQLTAKPPVDVNGTSKQGTQTTQKVRWDEFIWGGESSSPRIKDHLDTIRTNSAYPFLRRFINICIGLPFVVAASTWLFLIATDIRSFVLYGFKVIDPLMLAEATLCFVLIAVVLIVLRQSALVVIDIADTLLNEHSKK